MLARQQAAAKAGGGALGALWSRACSAAGGAAQGEKSSGSRFLGSSGGSSSGGKAGENGGRGSRRGSAAKPLTQLDKAASGLDFGTPGWHEEALRWVCLLAGLISGAPAVP